MRNSVGLIVPVFEDSIVMPLPVTTLLDARMIGEASVCCGAQGWTWLREFWEPMTGRDYKDVFDCAAHP